MTSPRTVKRTVQGLVHCREMRIYKDNGKENGNYHNGLYRDYRVYIGVL